MRLTQGVSYRPAIRSPESRWGRYCIGTLDGGNSDPYPPLTPLAVRLLLNPREFYKGHVARESDFGH
jgi:hypothetical protein